ncbi:MAG TPA: SPFH domain-containing protein [Thermoanaerobaculia bacterium]
MPILDVIEWNDESGTEMVHRVPSEGSAEVRFGSQLIVRPWQAAIFFHAGKGLDVFGAGRHTLSTKNLPIVTKILTLPFGFTSPFRTEVYFVNLKVFTNMRWGTKDPVAFRDRELGLVRLRAFGAFTVQISQPLLFLNALVGSVGNFDTSSVEDYLREIIVSRLNDYLGESVDTLFDLPKHYDEMGVAVRDRLLADFAKYGIELKDFLINRITPPEDVQKMIDERSGMAAVGNLDEFMKFKAAKAMGDAALGGGTGMGAGVGLGMGAGVGALLPGMIFKGLTPAEAEKKGSVSCPECHGDVPLDSRFCPHCGNQMVVIRKCPSCSKNVTAMAKFCPACGTNLAMELHCTSCNAKLPPGTKFCMSCGGKVATT